MEAGNQSENGGARRPKTSGMVDARAAFDERKRQVLEGVDLHALVAESVELHKHGREWRGLCPFHGDRSPSLYVVPAKRIYHCFGCGASGDAIKWVQDRHGLTFKAAVNHLAERLGLMPSTGAAPPPPLKAAEPDPHRLRREQLMRERAIESAVTIWRMARGGKGGVIGTPPAYREGAGEDHPRMRAYLEHRGIPVDRLPGGKIPKALRFLGSCPTDEGGTHRPAMVGLFSTGPGEMSAVHRIFLDAAGPGKAAMEAAKKAKGSLRTGGAIKLSAPDQVGGTLILCEGIETGLALLASLRGGPLEGAAVWSVVSTSGYQHFRVGPELVEPAFGGWVRRVIFAADHNKLQEKGNLQGKRAGEWFAQVGAARFACAYPSLPVVVAPPDHRLVPELVGPDGELIEAGSNGKAIDWLDVANKLGYDRVGAALASIAPARAEAEDLKPAEPGQGQGTPGRSVDDADAGETQRAADERGGDGDDGRGNTGRQEPEPQEPGDGPMVGITRTARAQELLWRLFAPSAKHRPGGVWMLRRYAGTWWTYDAGTNPAWRQVEDPEMLEAQAGLLFDQYFTVKRGKMVLWAPGGRNITDVLKQAIAYTAHCDDHMPAWASPTFDRAGEPVWASSVRWSRSAREGPIRPEAVVCLPNGLLDADEWKAGRLRIVPNGPNWFSRTCMPTGLPIELLEEAVAADDRKADELCERLAPEWLGFLRSTFTNDEERIGQLQKWFGYCLTSDISLHKILWLQGAPGSGKGTIREVLTRVIGDDNIAMTTVEGLAGKFDLAAFVGRSVVFMPEVRVGFRTDTAAAMDRLLSISGGDPQSIEDKFQKKQPNIRLSCKFVVTPNEEPDIKDASVALMRRLLVIPTGQPVAQPDPGLARRITTNEAQGTLLWALIGLRRLWLARGFTQPAAGREIMESIERTQSPVRAFIADRCIVQAGSEVEVGVLHTLYQQWAEAEGRNPLAKERFATAMRATNPLVDTKQRAAAEGGPDGRRRWRVFVNVRPLLPRESLDDPYTPRPIYELSEGADHWPLSWGRGTRVSDGAGAAAVGEPDDDQPAPF